MPNYESKEPLNLQEVARDLDARLKALEPKAIDKYPPTVTERVDSMLAGAHSHAPKTEWTPTPPKK
jgi:hypothetical protein